MTSSSAAHAAVLSESKGDTMTRAKPLFIALALAMGASAPAFAQSSDSGGNTNAKTTPPAVAPAQVNGMSGAPVRTETYGTTTTTVVTPAPSTVVTPAPTTVAPMTSEEEHGGLRNRMHHDEHAVSDDAAERASRAKSSEEEHGGTRNRIKAKKERTRERLGLGHDAD